MARVEGLLDRMPAGRLEERLLWLREFMASNYKYSTQIDNPDQLDPLENFLFAEKAGYCDFFATAGALMARMIGVPSRVAYGYSKGEFDGEKLLTFYADGAHSWTEIYLDRYGWVVFDLSPSAGGDVDPSGGLADGAAGPPDLSDFEESDSGGEGSGGEGAGGSGEPDIADLGEKNSALSDLIIYIIFCLALLMFALWYYLKRDPDREAKIAQDGKGGPARNLPAYLAEFCRLVQSFGLEPQCGETLVEMLRALRRAGVPVEEFEAMKQYHYSTRYEDQATDSKLERRFLQEVRSFLKENLASAKS
jgi:hypothetical protein